MLHKRKTLYNNKKIRNQQINDFVLFVEFVAIAAAAVAATSGNGSGGGGGGAVIVIASGVV